MGEGITAAWARLLYTEIEHSLATSANASPAQVLNEIGDHLLNDPDGPHISDSAFKRARQMIQLAQPLLVLQIGVFVGYQAIQLAGVMSSKDAHYVCFELDPEFANVAKLFISLAGMSQKIEVLVGDESEVMSQFLSHYSVTLHHPVIEFIVLNHWKHIYLPDLIKLEHLGFITEKTIVICDDMVFPGIHQLVVAGETTDEGSSHLHLLDDSHDSDLSQDSESSVSRCSYDSLTALKGRHFISKWDAHSTTHD